MKTGRECETGRTLDLGQWCAGHGQQGPCSGAKVRRPVWLQLRAGEKGGGGRSEVRAGAVCGRSYRLPSGFGFNSGVRWVAMRY